MSITPSTGIRSTRARIALVPLLSLGLLGGSVAFAGPVQAHDDRRDDRHGCTVKPLDPKDLRGNKVDFRIKADCDGKKTVHIRQLRLDLLTGPSEAAGAAAGPAVGAAGAAGHGRAR